MTNLSVLQTNYYILVASDVDKRRLSEPSAYDIAVHRLVIGKWGLRTTTRNRKRIKPGDWTVVYAAGKRENGGTIVGVGQVATKPQLVDRLRNPHIDSPTRSSHVVCEYFIDLSQTVIFKNPVPLRPNRFELSFIKNPESLKWAARLQNAVAEISKADFMHILDLASTPLDRKVF